MSNVHTSAGTTLNILAALPATYDETGFDALTWNAASLVGEVSDIGEIPDREYNTATHLPLGGRRAVVKKTSYKQPPMTIQMARDTADAGQALLKTALRSDNDYAFRVTLQDGTIVYFTGQVTKVGTPVGNADAITGLTATVELSADPIEILPA